MFRFLLLTKINSHLWCKWKDKNYHSRIVFIFWDILGTRGAIYLSSFGSCCSQVFTNLSKRGCSSILSICRCLNHRFAKKEEGNTWIRPRLFSGPQSGTFYNQVRAYHVFRSVFAKHSNERADGHSVALWHPVDFNQLEPSLRVFQQKTIHHQSTMLWLSCGNLMAGPNFHNSVVGCLQSHRPTCLIALSTITTMI